jgi:phosphate transport system permease protein
MDAREGLYLRRQLKNQLAMLLAGAAAIFGLFWLVWILWTTVTRGVANLNLDLFTMMTPPPEERGGLLNAFFGSAVIRQTKIASLAWPALPGLPRLLQHHPASTSHPLSAFDCIGLFVYALVVVQLVTSRHSLAHRVGVHRLAGDRAPPTMLRWFLGNARASLSLASRNGRSRSRRCTDRPAGHRHRRAAGLARITGETAPSWHCLRQPLRARPERTHTPCPW